MAEATVATKVLDHIVRSIVDDPDKVRVEAIDDDGTIDLGGHVLPCGVQEEAFDGAVRVVEDVVAVVGFVVCKGVYTGGVEGVVHAVVAADRKAQ